ncbi:16046_t:CDS:2, partial [Cetraspora pellucida]
GVTESKGSSQEELDNDIISEQYKISAKASLPSIISHLLQIPKDLNIIGLLATILDLYFKLLSDVLSDKRNEIIEELKKRVNLSIQLSAEDNLSNTVSSISDMSLFYDDEIELNSLINTELQARIFLAVSATSVPSERLFSSIRNVLTDKYNHLSSNIVHALLFLKENLLVINVYIGL